MEGSLTATRVRFAVEDDVDEDSRPSKRRRTDSLQLAGKDEPRRNAAGCGHRLGVLPTGNLFLTGSSTSKNIRPGGLGTFNVLPDAVLLVVLASFDANTLLALRTASRAFFAYSSHEPIWKDLVVSRANGKLRYWEGSWRKTYIRSFGRCDDSPSEWPTDSIRTPGIYSDELYQPALCAHTSLTPYFLPHPTRPRCTIAKADASSLTAETFSSLYAIPSKPVLISSAMNGWPSLQQSLWTMDALETRFKDISFRAEAFDLPFHVYRQYSDDCDEEDSPLYLFDSRFVEKTGGAMGKGYTPFPFFGEDLFALLGAERPNYRWLIAGPARSGSTFHKDPNGTSAWNAVLCGRKGWVMFPPDVCPPGVYTNEDESEVTSPLSIPEWFLTYFDYAWSTYGPSAKDPELRGKMIVGVCGLGEVVYVPSGWWHLVVNLDESVAVTQNFVSETELTNVIRFMRDKPDQLSGFKGSLTPSTIYERFTRALQENAPETYIRAMGALEKTSPPLKRESVWDKVVSTSDEPATVDGEAGGGFSFGFEFDEGEEEGEEDDDTMNS